MNDKRFRSVFKNVSPADWEKIAERFAVTNAAGIQSRDGYLFGAGCKAHFCNTDQAAFAINEATGKGDLVFSETPDNSNTAVVCVYQWPELPISETPLIGWAKDRELDLHTLAAPAPMLRTSFDCTKARSEAERIICSDPELAASDVQLAELYAKARASAKDPAAFKAQTRAQWKLREQQCHDRECVVHWYANRRALLAEFANSDDVAKQ